MIDKKILNQLQQCLGKDKVFSEKEYLVTYSYDATGVQVLPDVVVFPECDDHIQGILKIAYENKVPVTPRGAGVGLSGGSIPVNGGIALSFTRMNKILSIDTQDSVAIVEPGVVTVQLQEAVQKKGLFYPPDPASLKTSTIGGNVAENAGGLRCYKYGVTGNYVLGLEGFLMNGEKIKAGSHVIKNVAGYDLKSLLVGSEGTLAVISKIILRLIPLPQHRVLFRVGFKTLRQGAEFINKMIRGNIYPSVLEFMDRSSIDAVSKYLGVTPNPEINAIVITEIDGNRGDVEERKKTFQQIVDEAGVLECHVADTLAQQEELWKLRRNISPAIAKIKPKKINEDIVVPTSKIPETVDYIKSLGNEYNITIILFGHFGDGNIHTNVMVDPADPEEVKRAEIVLDKIFRHVISLNGSISGEHGIGTAKKPFMSYQFNPVEIDLFRGVKQVFDPLNLLNPGKIF